MSKESCNIGTAYAEGATTFVAGALVAGGAVETAGADLVVGAAFVGGVNAATHAIGEAVCNAIYDPHSIVDVSFDTHSNVVTYGIASENSSEIQFNSLDMTCQSSNDDGVCIPPDMSTSVPVDTSDMNGD
jgi:hypothetical protein